MAQLIYGLIAIMMIMILSFTFLRNVTETEQQMVINEVASQVTGVSMEILDHVGQRYFDQTTDPVYVFPKPPQHPFVDNEACLTTAGSGNWGCPYTATGTGDWGISASGCPDGILNDTVNCNDIDDFDGMTVVRDVDGIRYEAVVNVQYVNSCTMAPSSKSFAKEVTLDITSPDLRIGHTPLTVTVSRVYTYDRITCTDPATCVYSPCSP